MWTKSRSLFLSRILIWLFIPLLLVGFVILPNLLQISGENIPYQANFHGTVWIISLRFSIIPVLAALFLLHNLLKNIRQGQVFTNHNIMLIRVISWCCHLVAVIFLFLGITYIHLSALIISAIIGFCGLILRVVKNVLVQAMAIKDENDLTV